MLYDLPSCWCFKPLSFFIPFFLVEMMKFDKHVHEIWMVQAPTAPQKSHLTLEHQPFFLKGDFRYILKCLAIFFK